MSEEFVITSDVMRNPKFLACSVLARTLYLAMILKTDHEGRALADPLTWMADAALFGAAACTVDQVAAALTELDVVRLAPRYEVDGRSFVFLPGRFEHNPQRTYWRRSKCPLPPVDKLSTYPEYLAGLLRLTTKSEMRNSLRSGENWRYPHLAQQIPESGGQQQGNSPTTEGVDRATPVGVGVEVDLRQEGDSSTAVHESTRAESVAQHPESPPVAAQADPEEEPRAFATRRQWDFAGRLLAQHGLTVEAWMSKYCPGRVRLLDSHVDLIRTTYGGRVPPYQAPGNRAYEAPQPPDPDMTVEERAAASEALVRAKAAARELGYLGVPN